MRKIFSNRSAFTLLEMIVVIIIVGVLAALALPRMFRTVEYSRATEALQNISSIRQAIERCYFATRSYSTCNSFSRLDLADPTSAPNSHFTYTLPGTFDTSNYTILATRNTRDGGNPSDWIQLQASGSDITRTGNGNFAGVQ